MRVAEVARQLRTTSTTIRRWSNEFALILHPPARGGNNAVRQFDSHDLQVLTRASDLLSLTGATYAQVKGLLLEEFVGPRVAPKRADDNNVMPSISAPVRAQNGGEDPTDKKFESTPPLEELVAAAVTAATRAQTIHMAGLTETIETLGRDVRDLKTRVIALEEIALSKRGRWPFSG